jgi:DNA polymerase III subunit epsilon
MEHIVVLDCETNGIPDWKMPSDSEHQPHLVQLAAHLVEVESRKVVQTIDLIIKPEDWVITQETIDIHGITNEHAMEVGIPEKQALEILLALCAGRKRVAFNTTYDNRIIRIATKRYCSEEVINAWHQGEYECAMIASRKIMGGKQPTLAEAYKHFTGKEIQNAHTAIGDVNACMEVYFAVKDHLAAVA